MQLYPLVLLVSANNVCVNNFSATHVTNINWHYFNITFTVND